MWVMTKSPVKAMEVYLQVENQGVEAFEHLSPSVTQRVKCEQKARISTVSDSLYGIDIPAQPVLMGDWTGHLREDIYDQVSIKNNT